MQLLNWKCWLSLGLPQSTTCSIIGEVDVELFPLHAILGKEDKSQITDVLGCSMSGDILPFQLIRFFTFN